MIGAVRLRPTLEVVARDDAGEAVALADADDVHQLAGLEHIDAQLLAELVSVGYIETELTHVLRTLLVLVEVLELARDRLRGTARGSTAELHGRIAVGLDASVSRDRVRGRLAGAAPDDAAVV